MKHFAVLVWPIAVSAVSGGAATGAQPLQGQIDPDVLAGFDQLSEQMGGLDWEQQRPAIERAISNIWKSNGWNDEADRFAQDLACEISAIPPSEPLRRIRALTESLVGRYGLSEDQAARFQGAMMRETAGLLLRNAGVILEQTREGMEARVRGEPFNPKQVARWMKESEPLLRELRESVERLAKELEPMLEPSKRQTLQKDMMSFDKRRKVIDKMAARWAEGKWRPDDWGLQDDPVHGGRARGTDPVSARRDRESIRGAGREVARPLPRWVPFDPETWFAYVLDFKKRFDLDAGQMSTAESILTELRDRALQYAEAHAEQLKGVPSRERSKNEAYEPIRVLFRELQDRLDAIPTSGQRTRNKP